MQIGDRIPGAVERPPLEDVVVLVDGSGVAVGVERAVRRMSCVHDDGGGRSFRCVEIQVVGSDGEVSGILRRTDPPREARGAVADREAVVTIADVRQLSTTSIIFSPSSEELSARKSSVRAMLRTGGPSSTKCRMRSHEAHRFAGSSLTQRDRAQSLMV